MGTEAEKTAQGNTEAAKTDDKTQSAESKTADQLYNKPAEEKKADEKPAETKPAAEGEPEKKVEPPAKPVVPEKYDLKLPDGSRLEAAHVEKIASYSKEHGLSNEQAQKLLERDNSLVADFFDGQKAQFEANKTAWLEESKTDKEIGGDSLGKNAELSKRVLDRFGTEKFKQLLDETGAGNHPEFIRVFTRIGRLMSEDQFVMPGTQPTNAKKSTEEILYGGSKKE